MGKRAKTTVVLSHPQKGGVHVFVEGDQLPDWALGEITNPEIVDLDDSGDSGDSGGSDKPAAKPRTRAPRRTPAKAKAPAKAAATATAKTDDAPPPAGDGTDAKE